MRKFRFGLIIVAIILTGIILTYLDYNELSWSSNKGSYLGIISQGCLITAMILSNRYENKKG